MLIDVFCIEYADYLRNSRCLPLTSETVTMIARYLSLVFRRFFFSVFLLDRFDKVSIMTAQAKNHPAHPVGNQWAHRGNRILVT